MFDLIYKRGCRRVLGVHVFGYSLSFPDLKEYPRIAAFYRDICALAAESCDTQLGPRAEADFLSLSERDRQTVFRPYAYALTGEVSYFDSEIMIIKLTAVLKNPRLGQIQRIFEVHAWSLDDERLIPPRQVARRFIPKGRLPSMMGDCGFLAEGENYYLCKNGSLSPIEISKGKV